MSEIFAGEQSTFTVFFGRLGRHVLRGLEQMGDATRLGLHALGLMFAKPWQGKHYILQLLALGVGSLAIIVITGAVTGMVLALQG
jgi:phospholipid/cholesterol/gamma-HCH transport system permease protein